MKTAQEIIDGTRSLLRNLDIATDNVDNNATLLGFLNLAKNQIAVDTLLWVGGESFTIDSSSSVYTLSTVPIAILDVYDHDMNIRQRNATNDYGYVQISPNKIRLGYIPETTILYVNYYYTPDDYLSTNSVPIPDALINAMQYFIAHKAYEMYKGEKELTMSGEYFRKYSGAVNNYKDKFDPTAVDNLATISPITLKGLV